MSPQDSIEFGLVLLSSHLIGAIILGYVNLAFPCPVLEFTGLITAWQTALCGYTLGCIDLPMQDKLSLVFRIDGHAHGGRNQHTHASRLGSPDLGCHTLRTPPLLLVQGKLSHRKRAILSP